MNTHANDDLVRRIASVHDESLAGFADRPAAQNLLANVTTLGVPRDAPRPRRRVLISGLVAASVAAGAVAVVTTSNTPHHRVPPTFPGSAAPSLQLVAVTSPIALATNAATVARQSPVPPGTAWVYVKSESTISHDKPGGAMAQVPGSHHVQETWTRVDMQYVASIVHGKVTVSSTNGGFGNPVGWPSITYPYLNSLPNDPDKLLAVIRANIRHQLVLTKRDPRTVQDAWVFESILALMENYPTLPPRLNAALYGALARLKVAHLERARDNAGRKVLSLYMNQDGMKTSIFIDPATYAFAGQRRAAVADRTTHGLDTTVNLHKGEILNDTAILVSRIVNTPGARS